jgi:hypothetical protein
MTTNKGDVLAARVLLKPALELRVVAQSFNGRLYLHIREYALADTNEFVPTPRGISVPIEKLDEVLDAIRQLRESGDEIGIVSRVPLGAGREVHFAVTSWNGVTKADIRLYITTKTSDEPAPTRKGIRVNLTLLAEIERSLELLERTLNK